MIVVGGCVPGLKFKIRTKLVLETEISWRCPSSTTTGMTSILLNPMPRKTPPINALVKVCAFCNTGL